MSKYLRRKFQKSARNWIPMMGLILLLVNRTWKVLSKIVKTFCGILLLNKHSVIQWILWNVDKANIVINLMHNGSCSSAMNNRIFLHHQVLHIWHTTPLVNCRVPTVVYICENSSPYVGAQICNQKRFLDTAK